MKTTAINKFADVLSTFCFVDQNQNPITTSSETTQHCSPVLHINLLVEHLSQSSVVNKKGEAQKTVAWDRQLIRWADDTLEQKSEQGPFERTLILSLISYLLMELWTN